MSEKPQASHGEEHEDLLEQIFTQGLERLNAPPPEDAAKDDPPDAAPSAAEQTADEQGAARPERNSLRISAHLYLPVLLGAAFLVLLLAYFIQRRDSENTINDLRSSQEELLSQVKALEAENDSISVDLTIMQRRYEEQQQSSNTIINQLIYNSQEALYCWDSFWTLEQFYQIGNLEACAAILLLQELGQYTYSTPDAVRARYGTIVRAVIDAGILDETYKLHVQDYQALLDAYSQP